ncbi:alpha/beta hydrolase family protein [Acidaminobacterium chupaoyuni]
MNKITIEDFASVKFLSELTYSPDGKRAAFVVSQAHVKTNKYSYHIWLLENGKTRRLTGGGAERGLAWLDNETIVFPGDRTGKYKNNEGKKYTVFNKINVCGGEAEEFFAVPFPARNLIPVGEEEMLVIGTYDHNQIKIDGLCGAEREEALEKIAEEKDYEVFDELPFWFNGKGVINKLRNRVYLCNLKTSEQKALSPEFMDVSTMKYRKATGDVLFFGSEYQWIDNKNSRVIVYNLKNGDQHEMDLFGKLRVSAADFVGDKLVIAGSTCEKYGSSENPVFYTGDIKTGKLTLLADLDTSLGSSVGCDCRYGGGRSMKATEDALYYSETIGFSSYIVKLTLDGKTAVVSPKVSGSIDGFDLHDGKFIYVGIRNCGLQEIYTCTENGEETKLTAFNDEYLNTHSVIKPKYMKFTDQDGVEIDGWVIEPLDFDMGKTYPGILNVHGGPKAVFGETFFHEMQFWANEGYFVFYCNPRGGDGRGNEFADIRGDHYGVLDYNDLMEFTDRVLEKYPQIDAKRIGMAGGSYGGFMANWIVGHTDRFAAVASQRSISNYISKCLTTDIGYYHNLSAIDADPWTSHEKMWDHSPLKYADKAKTPTLFIQSDEDYRCWMTDAIQMLTALRMHGVPTRMCLFHGENHELSRSGKPKHRVRRLKEITGWFDQYMK